jgi:hypothetical protein
MRLQILTAVVAVAVLAGCQKKAEAPAAPAAEPAAPVATAPAAEAPAAEAAAAPAEVAGFGVAECDAYFQKMMECIDSKVPEAGREQFKTSLEASRSAWQQAASTPEGKAGLAAACTQATEVAKTSMAAYGCAF